MKYFSILILSFLLFGCTDSKINEADLEYLNGYWEIEKVEFPRGDIKEYKANTMVDFIHLENKKGMRKKVQPRLDGTYIVSEDEEAFEIIKNQEQFSFYYKSNFSERQEQLKTVDSLSFVIQNEDGILYYYTRFQPISIQL